MSFNPMMGATIVRIRKFLPDSPKVIELGSQTLKLEVKGRSDITTVPDFYHELGFIKYDALDFNDAGTILWDLNQVVDIDETYDLVTNNGTGEHIFNQAAVFESCHILCKKGGLIVHVLPWINWLNHGFYNFQPNIFHDIAHANGYETLEVFSGDRWGEIEDEYLPPGKLSPRNTDQQLLIVAIFRKQSDGIFVVPTQNVYQSSAVK